MIKKRLYIDMDDTICDFLKAYKEKWTEKIQYPQTTYGFFANLEPIEGAIDAINLLKQHFDLWILTRPSIQNPLCYTEKRVWIEKHFGIEMCNRLIISPDKSLFIGDYLIDDNYHDFQGELILFGKKEEFMTWTQILDYLL